MHRKTSGATVSTALSRRPSTNCKVFQSRLVLRLEGLVLSLEGLVLGRVLLVAMRNFVDGALMSDTLHADARS